MAQLIISDVRVSNICIIHSSPISSLIYVAFEVAVNLESPLMSDYLRSDLNPTVITIHKATNMPTQQIAEQMQR